MVQNALPHYMNRQYWKLEEREWHIESISHRDMVWSFDSLQLAKVWLLGLNNMVAWLQSYTQARLKFVYISGKVLSTLYSRCSRSNLIIQLWKEMKTSHFQLKFSFPLGIWSYFYTYKMNIMEFFPSLDTGNYSQSPLNKDAHYHVLFAIRKNDSMKCMT